MTTVPLATEEETEIPFADGYEQNNEGKCIADDTNLHRHAENPRPPLHGDTVDPEKNVENKPKQFQAVADVHNPDRFEVSKNNAQDFSKPPESVTKEDRSRSTEDLELEDIAIKPTRNISELKAQIVLPRNFVQAAGSPADDDSITAAKGEDMPDGPDVLTAAKPSHKQTEELAPLTEGSRDQSGPKPLSRMKSGEKILIPAGKRKNTKKKRRPTLREWLTCTFIEKESHDTGPTYSTAAAQPNIRKVDDILDAFLHYNHDTPEPERPHGRGLCVIFTLFTGELRGYYADRARAFKFFQEKLGYEVYCDSDFVNCSRTKMMSSIKQIQKVIAREARIHGRQFYDRFVFIILTHGEKDGLMTCADPSGVLEERRQVLINNEWKLERALTKIEDIVAHFRHDKVPELKGKPKMFLIQACRGSDVLQTASAGGQKPIGLPKYDLSNLSLRPEVPIEADMLVLYATTPDHESWVSPTEGSWFIQKSISVFERHYKQRHAEEMMTLINFVISEERGKALNSDGRSFSEVAQMPCKFSTLRMRFYL